MEAKQLKTVNGCPTCHHARPEEPINPWMLVGMVITGVAAAWLSWFNYDMSKGVWAVVKSAGLDVPEKAGNAFLYAMLILISAVAGLIAFVAFAVGCEFFAKWIANGWSGFSVVNFYDDEIVHTHGEDPMQKTSVWHPWWEAHPNAAILRVRYGGYFRRTRILSPSKWHIVSGWKGLKDVTIAGKDGIAIGPMKEGLLFTLLENFESFSSIIEAGALVGPAVLAREHLGQGVASCLKMMQDQRSTMGRSEHAKAIREKLQKLLMEIPLGGEARNKLLAAWGFKPATMTVEYLAQVPPTAEVSTPAEEGTS